MFALGCGARILQCWASCLSKKREKENETRELGQELCALTSALRPQIRTGEAQWQLQH